MGLFCRLKSVFSAIRVSKPEVHNILDSTAGSSIYAKLQKQRRKASRVWSAIPETAASVAIAATVVGTAATLLVRRTKASETNKIVVVLVYVPNVMVKDLCLRNCHRKVLEKARLNAKNMATRYTAGLPKKWSYCTKCFSARSCITCGGRGR